MLHEGNEDQGKYGKPRFHRVAPAPVTGVGERQSYLISPPTTVKPALDLKYLDGVVTNKHVQIAHIVNDNSSILKLTY